MDNLTCPDCRETGAPAERTWQQWQCEFCGAWHDRPQIELRPRLARSKATGGKYAARVTIYRNGAPFGRPAYMGDIPDSYSRDAVAAAARQWCATLKAELEAGGAFVTVAAVRD